ncbi:MAG: uracil-DNA glycosylase [Candidatus Parcubacteria bacterium]|nr:uracil-DNA glycosylase [Candidatus Parcubacteria bacterium]
MKSQIKIEPSWKKILSDEFDRPYFAKLTDFVRNEYQGETVYPPPKFMFQAFELCPFDKVKVVILGQDPYHGPKQANGLCFSVNEKISIPPSLQNIYKEISNDLAVSPPSTGNLTHWAEQGILLLNATLTVRANAPGSHQHQGWEEFTDAVIQELSDKKENLVFLLWGKYAQEKGSKIDKGKHLVLTAAHPSPFSAYHGFFGCKHFSKTNEYLKKHGEKDIKWT